MLGTIDFQKAPELAQDFASAPAEAVAHFYVALTLWSAKLDCHKTVSELEDAVRIWPNFAFAKASMDQQRNECRSSQEADRGQQSATEHTKP